MANKIEKHINMPNRQKPTSKYAKICKIKLHILSKIDMQMYELTSPDYKQNIIFFSIGIPITYQ